MPLSRFDKARRLSFSENEYVVYLDEHEYEYNHDVIKHVTYVVKMKNKIVRIKLNGKNLVEKINGMRNIDGSYEDMEYVGMKQSDIIFALELVKKASKKVTIERLREVYLASREDESKHDEIMGAFKKSIDEWFLNESSRQCQFFFYNRI